MKKSHTISNYDLYISYIWNEIVSHISFKFCIYAPYFTIIGGQMPKCLERKKVKSVEAEVFDDPK